MKIFKPRKDQKQNEKKKDSIMENLSLIKMSKKNMKKRY